MERRIQYGWSWGAERERFPGRQVSVSLSPLRSEATCGNGAEHSGSPLFADTEEVTGSNPVAPTTPLLSRAFRVSVVRRVARRPMVDRPQRQESISLLDQGVHFCGLPNL